MFLEILFWLIALSVAYAYIVYPVVMYIWARLCPRAVHRDRHALPSVTIVLAAHNEQNRIGARVDELAGLLMQEGIDGELIVVSDGSVDRTAGIARSRGHDCVHVIELPRNMGKAVALNTGCAAARGEIIVFADARQTWDRDALKQLLANFADPEVGGVSGELILEERPGVMAGVGMYWRYEKRIRRSEAEVHSTVGVTGAISAVRRSLFRPIPAGTILDDVYWPMRVVMQGYRVVHDPEAKAFDRLPDHARDEFRRKVRTLSSNFQLVSRLPQVLLRSHNPLAFQFISHKLMRLVVPWALLALLPLSLILPGAIYHVAFWVQITAYMMGVAGVTSKALCRFRPISVAASLVVLNSAAFLAFWVWISGNAGNTWKKVTYAPGSLQPRGV